MQKTLLLCKIGMGYIFSYGRVVMNDYAKATK